MGQNVDCSHTTEQHYKYFFFKNDTKFDEVMRFSDFPPTERYDYVIKIIDPWCEKHLQGRFAVFYSHQYFEFEEDKTMFILRWA